MTQRPKPILLRPMTREMKTWRLCFMIGFVVAVGFGWFMTVGRFFGTQVKSVRAEITDTLSDTAEVLIKEGNPVAPAQEKLQQINDQFQHGVSVIKGESVKQEIYQNMTTKIKSGSASK